MVKDEDSVRGSLAANPNTPIEALKKLSRDDESWIRETVAGNPSATPELLKALAGDEEDAVRIGVIQNPKVPAEVLAELAMDRDSFVRFRVAELNTTPIEVLQKLVSIESGDSGTLLALARNPSADVDLALVILKRLAAMGDESFRESCDESDSEFSIAAIFEQISRLSYAALQAVESADADEIDAKQGELDGYNLVFDFMEKLNPEEMGPGSETHLESLQDFLEDHMGGIEFFEEDQYEEDEIDYEGGKWSALNTVLLALINRELIPEYE